MLSLRTLTSYPFLIGQTSLANCRPTYWLKPCYKLANQEPWSWKVVYKPEHLTKFSFHRRRWLKKHLLLKPPARLQRPTQRGLLDKPQRYSSETSWTSMHQQDDNVHGLAMTAAASRITVSRKTFKILLQGIDDLVATPFPGPFPPLHPGPKVGHHHAHWETNISWEMNLKKRKFKTN